MKKYKIKTEKNYNFFALEFKIPKLPLNTKFEIIWPVKFFQESFFLRIPMIFRDFKIIYREEIDDISVKSFTGRYFGLISYLKTVLESWMTRQKSYHCPSPVLPFFMV